jgi:AcrR family transcriptional regulator
VTITNVAARGAQRSPDKRRAILRGGLAVFARQGYTRGSIEAIAEQAVVSTRTIYNHFGDKAKLFEAVIQASATEVADAQIRLINQYLHRVTDIEADLIEFGIVWATPMSEFADHFAMVRQVNAEIGHLPPAVIEAWQEAGPRRVGRELAVKFGELADRGLLRLDDPLRACTHFSLLTTGEVSSRGYRGALPVSPAEITASATAGVRAFLYGYGGTRLTDQTQ